MCRSTVCGTAETVALLPHSQPGGAGGAGNQNGQLTTGNISIDGASFAAFAGVQTASFSTGLGALNQSATSLAANANISFGP